MTATIEQSRPPATRSWWVGHRYLLAIGGITLLGAAVRIFGLGSEPMWLDETHTVDFTKLTLGELWSFDPVYNKANPPGYIVLMKAWAQFSRSDEWFRAPSVIAGVLTIPLVYAICARMGNRRAGLVAALLLALAGYHVHYSQEARVYAILTFLVAVILLAVVQLVTEPDGDLARPVRNRAWVPRSSGQGLRRAITWTDLAWPAYGIALGLVLHMHNTSLTVPLAANVGVGIWWLRQKPKPPRFARNWVLANLLGLAIWATWIPGFLNQLDRVSTSFWATLPTLQTLLRDFAIQAEGDMDKILPFTRSPWLDALVIVGVLALVWLGIRRMSSAYRPVILSFIIVHPLAELLYSLRRPVFLARTLIWIGLGTVVAIGFAVSRLRGTRLLLAVGALLVIPVLGTLGYHLGFEKTPWDEAAEAVAAEAGPEDVVFVMSPNNEIPFNHYFDQYAIPAETVGIPWELPDRERPGMVLNPSDFDIILDLAEGRERVWLVLNRAVLVTNHENVDPVLRANFPNVEEHLFQDLRVIEYSMGQ